MSSGRVLIVLCSVITFILQSKQYLVLKYKLMAIDLMNLGHTLTDFRNNKQIFILICDLLTFRPLPWKQCVKNDNYQVQLIKL